MVFWSKRSPHEDYDEGYARRPVRHRREEPLVWVHLGYLLVIGMVALGSVWGTCGLPILEDVLKSLATPVGLVWLLLLIGIWFSCIFRNGRTAFLLFLVWGILTVGGNDFVSQFLARSLEREWLLTQGEAVSKPIVFDLVVVLGGGTTADPNCEPQLGSSGDRVMSAAQLFHLGRAKKICVTGEQEFRTDANDPEPAEEARDLLIEIGVPAESIVALRGTNTSHELFLLKSWLDQQPESGEWKIGLVTSAWHMTRAMGLARKNGIQNIEALPADWRSAPFAPSPGIVIPSASNLDNTAKMLHEHLGRLIGR